MSTAAGRARQRIANFGAAVGAVAALTLLSATPASAAREQTGARPADHTVVFGGLLAPESAPRDLRAAAGDTISFENHAPMPALSPVRLTIGKDSFVIGKDPVLWTATESVSYQGSYTLLPGPLHHILVALAPKSPNPKPPGGGGGAGAPPAGPPAGSAPGQGAGGGTGAQAPAAPPATTPIVPAARPGDAGYVPAGAGIAPMLGHREDNADPTASTIVAPAFVPKSQGSSHNASMSRSDSAPLPVRVALAVFAGLMLAGVGSALARILFRAWLNAAPTTA